MYDYHNHTSFSDDCATSPSEMIESAISKGIKEFAITDHYDPDYPDPNIPFDLELPPYNNMLLEMEEKYRDKIKVVKGLEMGIQTGSTIEKCNLAAKSFNYDFIIGSFHCFNGYDLYTVDYSQMERNEILRDFYTYVYDGIKNFTDFDVLGHFNVIDRYILSDPRFDFDSFCDLDSQFKPYYNDVLDIVNEILIRLIYNNKGIEFNTSSFRYKLGDRTTPSKQILRMYKDLGGEIITLGSDSHTPSQIGYKFKEAKEILNSVGFKYQATYDNRKVKMINL